MGQNVCRYVSPSTGGRTTPQSIYYSSWQCSFEEARWFKEVFEGPNSYFYNLGFDVAGFVMIFFLWMLSAVIKYKDFSQSFVISNLISFTPYIIVGCIVDIQNLVYGKHSSEQVFYAVVNVFYFTLNMNFHITLIVFLAQNLKAARTRQVCKRSHQFYWILPFVIFIIYGIITFTNAVDNYQLFHYHDIASQGFMFIIGILELICLFALCCCSGARIGQSAEPSVGNAKSRMGWSLLFAIFASIPFSISVSFSNFYQYMSIYSMYLSYSGILDFIVHIFTLITNLTPIVFGLCVILFLPAYRSALCCSQGYYTGKIADVETIQPTVFTHTKKPITPPPAAAVPSAPPQTLSVPTTNQASSPYLSYQASPVVGPGVQDFGAVLTNPPNVMPYNPSQASVPVNQPCTCAHGNPLPMQQLYVASSNVVPLEQYQLVQHQPATIIAQQHVAPVAQGSLVRFASQPNLATMGTLQPAVSLPQLNVVQSPFYIAS